MSLYSLIFPVSSLIPSVLLGFIASIICLPARPRISGSDLYTQKTTYTPFNLLCQNAQFTHVYKANALPRSQPDSPICACSENIPTHKAPTHIHNPVALFVAHCLLCAAQKSDNIRFNNSPLVSSSDHLSVRKSHSHSQSSELPVADFHLDQEQVVRLVLLWLTRRCRYTLASQFTTCSAFAATPILSNIIGNTDTLAVLRLSSWLLPTSAIFRFGVPSTASGKPSHH